MIAVTVYQMFIFQSDAVCQLCERVGAMEGSYAPFQYTSKNHVDARGYRPCADVRRAIARRAIDCASGRARSGKLFDFLAPPR
ncbi:hypothetical protein SPHINGOR109_30159 [Sphingorhabdus sp. 109]|nr:hypothetical protein SPHINGOR109_30159 [Sphingorhabdus sp. 109]